MVELLSHEAKPLEANVAVTCLNEKALTSPFARLMTGNTTCIDGDYHVMG